MTPLWFHVQRCGETAHVFIGDNIGCWGAGADEFLAEIGNARDVQLTVNSIGGDARVACTLFEALRGGRISTATIIDRCGSSAVIVALAGERIRIARSGRMLLHAPSLAVLGTASDLRQSAEYLDELTGRWLDILCKRTKADAETVRSWLCGPDRWFTAQAAVAFGLADEVFDPPALQDTAAAVSGLADAESADTDDGSEALLLGLLQAAGPVTTQNRRRLGRELQFWFNSNVRQNTK